MTPFFTGAIIRVTYGPQYSCPVYPHCWTVSQVVAAGSAISDTTRKTAPYKRPEDKHPLDLLGARMRVDISMTYPAPAGVS